MVAWNLNCKLIRSKVTQIRAKLGNSQENINF